MRSLAFALAFLFLVTPASTFAVAKEIPAMAIEWSESVGIGSAVGPYRFAPQAIVIHNSASWPYNDYSDADMAAGYRRYHKETVHPGLFPQTLGYEIAQQNYPDGLSAPDGYDYNDIDYHALIGGDGAYYPGRDESTVGWHAGGNLPGMPSINTYALGLCGIGNFSERAPSEAQLNGMINITAGWMDNYNIEFWAVYPHYAIREWEYGYKLTSCPGTFFPWDEFYRRVRMKVAGFYDLDRTDWEYSAVRELTQKGTVTGFTSGYLYPEMMINRAEFITTVWKAAGSPEPVADSYFRDVPASEWYYPALNWAYAEGIIAGYPDGTIQPDGLLTRAQAAKIVSVWKKLNDSQTTSVELFPDCLGHWASSFIASAQDYGFINGYEDGTYRPDGFMLRCEAFSLLAKAD